MPKYEKATWDEVLQVQGPRPGARVLSDVVIRHYLAAGVQVKTGGIYNRRRVRGGTSWSLHAVGRGVDWMVPDKATGDQLFLRLINAADQCGVCEVIWNRQRWDGTTGKVTPYRGVNPHTDHVHAGMTIDVASHPDTQDLRRWFDHFLFVGPG